MIKIIEEHNIVIISMTLVVLSAILGLSVYHINDRNLMAKNIDNAIAKGINPMSVRCSYVRGDDPICIAFAAKAEEPVLQSMSVKK
jgi:hypothetical protein